MFGSVNVNEPVVRIRIVFIQPVEPKDARCDEVLSGRGRVIGPKRHARFENRSRRGAVSYFFRDAKSAQRRFHAAFLSPYSKTRTGNGIRTEDFAPRVQSE